MESLFALRNKKPRITALVFFVFNAAYFFLLYPLVSHLVEDMYYQRAAPFLNRLVEWRNLQPLEFYFGEVNRLHFKTLFCVNFLLWTFLVADPFAQFEQVYAKVKTCFTSYPRLLIFICLATAGFFLGTTVFYTLKYYLPIPYADTWLNVPLLEKWFKGTFTLMDAWAWHAGGQHRNVIPKLINIVIAAKLHWDFLYIALITLTLGTLCYAIFIYQLTRLKDRLGNFNFWLLVPVLAVFAFSMRMERSWTWDQGMYYYCALMPAYCGLAVLTGEKLGPFQIVLAYLLGLISLMSFSTGAVYGFGALYILIMRRPSGGIKGYLPALLFGLASAAAVAFYAHDYRTIEHLDSPFHVTKHLWKFIAGIFICLGNVAENSRFAFFFGLMALTVFVLLWRALHKAGEDKSPPVMFFLAAGMLSIFAAVLISSARSFLEARHMLDFNYVNFIYPFWISNFVLLCYVMKLPKNKAPLKYARLWQAIARRKLLIVILIFYTVFTSADTVRGMQWYHRYVTEVQPFLHEGTHKNELNRLFGNTRYLMKQREVMKKYRLNLFYRA